MKIPDVVNLAEKFALIPDLWHPRIVGELNDSHVKLARLKGEFVWHHHENEDELFFVIKGTLTIRTEQDDLVIGAGEFAVIPRMLSHCPVAEDEVWVMLIEPKSTLNTGNVQDEHTVEADWL